MNLLILDSGEYKQGDTVTLTIDSVMGGDSGFVASVTPSGEEAEESPGDNEEDMMEEEMSPEAAAVMKRGKK